ncbi:MAG: hypothetical protein EOO61_15440, partial [Hymenobacter sp.]
MIKKLPILFFLVFASLAAMAQPAALNCGNGRYVNDVFTTVTKTTGITYGVNAVTNYAVSPPASFPVTLQMDFYEPQG